jgi:hypothetical protein
LTKSLTPAAGEARFGTHGDLAAPTAQLDARRGMPFPPAQGGFMLASGGVIDDAAGTLEIIFTPGRAPSGALVQAWGQYQPLIDLTPDTLTVRIYGRSFNNFVDFRPGTEYTLRFSWDHRVGFTLSIRTKGAPAQVVRRRLEWNAFRQTYVPFSVGGMASDPRFRQWSGTFHGWVRSVKVWSAPMELPGPVAVTERGAPAPAPFAATPNVKVLAVDNPPIRPDPLGLAHLPDRIEDLRKGRRVCGFDEIVSKCKNGVEVFSRLTSHVGMTWPHTWYWPWPAKEQRWIFWKRSHELLPAIRRGEAGGMCGGYAHMMEEVFWSMGFDARRIQVRGHSSFEAHLSEQDRWVICDASWHDTCHMFADGRGTLLGAGDIIRRYEATERDADALKDVRPMLCREENLVEAPAASGNPMYGSWPYACYDHVGMRVDKTREYGRERSDYRNPGPSAYYFRPTDRPAFRKATLGLISRDDFQVTDLSVLYPSRNRAAVAMKWLKAGETLAVTARPVAVTFFDHFELSVDEGPAQTSAGAFRWTLHAGVNTLSVRTVNQLGAKGYPYRITLWKKAT